MKHGTLFAALLFVATISYADVFKCNTADGVVYSQIPCSNDATVLGIDSLILGSWLWKQDKMTLKRGGRGSYYRGGIVCYEFSYTLTVGNKLIVKADKPNTCGVGVETSYNIAMNSKNLVMQHIGSGFISIWKREI